MKKNYFFVFVLIIITIASLVAVFFVKNLWPQKKSHQTHQSDNFPVELDWSFDSDYRILRPPRLANTTVILHTEVAPLASFFKVTHIGLNAENGALLWKLPLTQYLGWSDELHWSFVGENTFFIGGGEILSVNLTSGASWNFKNYGQYSVAASKENIFVSSRGLINAFDADTGIEKWRRDSMPSRFVIFYDEESDILVVPDNDIIYILDPYTGKSIHEQKIEQDYDWDFICTHWIETIIYYENQIYCGPMTVDAYSGEVISNKDFDYSYNGYIWRPLIDNHVMYYRTVSGTIRALDLNKFELLWEYEPKTLDGRGINIISGAALLGRNGYAIAENGNLYAFGLATGEEIGWWKSPEGVIDWTKGWSGSTSMVGVVSSDEKLYVTFGKKTLYAFEHTKE